MAALEALSDWIHLRPIEPRDLPRIFDLQLDPESNRMAVVNPRSRESFDELWAKNISDPATTARAILLGDAFVGFISFFPFDGQDHVGYWIDRGHWGKGIASRALALFLEEVPRRPLIATAATSNLASLRVLQKCGFVVQKVHVSPGSERYPEAEVAVHILE
jgi:RimJ/RimL family protein N-acetyltransferase